MTKLWQKGFSVDQQVERFEAAQNSLLDTRLIRHDVWGSLAHVMMLQHIGVLTADELQILRVALQEILAQEATGDFVIKPADEDVHTSIEGYLASRTGAAGKKIHMARSRNDQVLVDMRLYGKEQLHRVGHKLLGLASALQEFAQQTMLIPMPGYTHMQRGMLSSVGLWAASFVESLLDDEQLLLAAYVLNDQSPLGSAAGYGVPLAIDRQYVSDQLGFARLQNNVIYTQNARGKIEGAVIQALTQIMLDLSKFAQDMLLYTTSEYGFFQFPQELSSGSSIMPQKRNLGVMELVRGRVQTMLALQQQVLGIVAGLPSGYNMDFQETKRPYMEAFDLVQECLDICALLISSIEVDSARLTAACTFELFAADRAYEMAMTQDMPFRDAYRIVGKEVTSQLDQHIPFPVESQEQLVQRLQARSHQGAPGNPGLEQSQQRLQQARSAWQERAATFKKAMQKLVGSDNISINEAEEN